MPTEKELKITFFKDKFLDKEVPIPLYFQLKGILLDYIKNHHPDLTEPIPPELELSRHFAISRPTVRQAINELVVEGFLSRLKGKGTFIRKPKISQEFLLSLDSYNNEMRRKSVHPATRLLSARIKRSSEQISKALELPLGSDVYELKRLRFANDEPIVVVDTYLPAEKCPDLLAKDLENESLYDLLERDYGLEVNHVVRDLEAIVADQRVAELLQIRVGEAVQFFASVTYLVDETPIEYSLAKYRGDRNRFTFKYRKS